MKKRFLKTAGIVSGSVISFGLVLILVVPLFISVQSYEGLSLAEATINSEGRIMTIPFEGTDGIDLYVVEKPSISDDKPVFVLLHGSNYNSATWDRVSVGLTNFGRTIAYDQIPYGLSEKLTAEDWSQDNPYTSEAAVQQLKSLLNTLNVSQVILVGSSFGGNLAIQAAVAYPELVRGLILVDAAVFVSESIPKGIMNSRQMNNLGPLMARSLGTNIGFYEKCYSDPSFFDGKRKEKTMVMTEITNWDIAYWEYLKAWNSTDTNFQSIAREVKIPTLVVSGENDKIVPVDDAVRLAEMLPTSSLSIIDGAGHLPHEENPEEFLQVVASWMTSWEKD
jgi:pimeloyl-ACP methyl ester carboxylesterase